MKYDFSGLGERQFQSLCQVLASEVLGASFQTYGEGKDGGRDGTFNGTVPYPPESDGSWRGYGVLQVKYMNGHPDTKIGTSWLKRHITMELDEWLAPDKDRVLYGQMPEYLIFASNVPLSPVPGKGGYDTINSLIAGYQKRLSLRDWRIWDYTQICTYVSRYPGIRDAFGLSTTGDVLASINRKLNRHPAAGEGAPWCANAFQETFEACGGRTTLGDAIDIVYAYGPGHVQFFHNGHTARRFVICTLGNGPGVAVPGRIWDTLCTLGHHHAGSGGAVSAGFPAHPAEPGAYLEPSCSRFTLRGGTWGPGTLVCTAEGGWTWQPEVSLSYNATRDRTTWTAGVPPMDVRLRLAARSHMTTAGLNIDRSGRQRLMESLSISPLVSFISQWARGNGFEGSQPQWTISHEPKGYNDNRHACYQLAIPGERDREAATVDVRLVLPDSAGGTVLTNVDLRIAFDAMLPGLKPTFPVQIPDKLRVSTRDLRTFLQDSWLTLTSLLLAATPTPLAIPLAGPSALEFHISSERTDLATNARSVRLEDVMDFATFGACTRTLPNDLSVAITASLTASADQVARISAQTLVFLAEGYGFIDVDPQLFEVAE